MSTVGPELPPHLLAKRKRQREQEEEAAGSTRERPSSPSESHPASSDGGEKRRRVAGPALPPAPLDEMPIGRPNEDEESSDDEFGPALPSADGPSVNTNYSTVPTTTVLDLAIEKASSEPKKPQHDEWMLIPPSQSDWTSHVDPTKLRNRKFNTGRGAKGPAQKSGTDNSIWTETPEQKRKRLEDEVLGKKKPANQVGEGPKVDDKESEETRRRIKEYNEKNRGHSLYAEHQKHMKKDEEDDPSARPFDREKDIARGANIGRAQRKELVNRASDFGSKFSGGGFL
ncbi:MAG: hypothetical protein M1834_004720 [Cirrosporium novae-zelandiae]|nr:MAG: hypothetical protein M1834_004720 [Cirrosporium novae-zelandiae]